MNNKSKKKWTTFLRPSIHFSRMRYDRNASCLALISVHKFIGWSNNLSNYFCDVRQKLTKKLDDFFTVAQIFYKSLRDVRHAIFAFISVHNFIWQSNNFINNFCDVRQKFMNVLFLICICTTL